MLCMQNKKNVEYSGQPRIGLVISITPALTNTYCHKKKALLINFAMNDSALWKIPTLAKTCAGLGESVFGTSN